MDESLQRCLSLLKENEEEVQKSAGNALLAICDNILSYPNDKQYREVRLDDSIVVEKLLPTAGAMECLFDIGFVEAVDHLILPDKVSLSKLQALRNFLAKKFRVDADIVTGNYNDLLSECSTSGETKFCRSIIQNFQNVLLYENPQLQGKARKLIPVTKLEIATMSRMRELQKRVKQSKANLNCNTEKEVSENDLDIKDLFIMELVHWFKYEFFTWMDNPRCSACFGICEYHKVIPSEDPKCSRIEIHRCTSCEELVKYPRFIDPEPLLSLRRGRCGEWANVFTLFCRSLGYDSRRVHDETDHVWTEVWSVNQKRWIHVDPCEDVVDRPLMYEKGWKKKLNYILAYSKDEIQDVTWRYTRDELSVMKRRQSCPESTLLQFIESLNKHHQCLNNYSAFRKQYMLKRRLSELVEMIHMPEQQNSNDNETYGGRSSGSYAWRLVRGEVSQASPENNYVWDISKYGETFHLCYSIIKDTYKIIDTDGQMLEKLDGWQNGMYDTKGGIFRKVENDWKIVYLARSEGEISGQVKWNFEIKNPDLCVSSFNLNACVKEFHGAKVSWHIEAFFNTTKEAGPLIVSIDDCSNYHTDQIKGSKFSLTATVFGSEGDCAWQHAQLFRHSLEDQEDRSLVIKIELKRR